jgi:hypothetical protein
MRAHGFQYGTDWELRHNQDQLSRERAWSWSAVRAGKAARVE